MCYPTSVGPGTISPQSLVLVALVASGAAGCSGASESTDARTLDSSTSDAGEDASARVDAGSRDASLRDAAPIDAALTDATEPDAPAPSDVGLDAWLPDSGPTRVFTTSAAYDGTLGGTGAIGADARCQALADAAALGGAWMAWISVDGAPPVERLGSGPFVNVNGAVVLGTRAELSRFDGSSTPSYANVSVDEHGAMLDRPPVWTGVASPSSPTPATCVGWTDASAAAFGTVGIAGETTYEWQHRTTLPCNEAARLYCFEMP